MKLLIKFCAGRASPQDRRALAYAGGVFSAPAFREATDGSDSITGQGDEFRAAGFIGFDLGVK